jgi:hypothetical protein
MERYIQQLIEDLEELAANSPAQTYIESLPHLDETPDIAELALVPYKTIAEWTEIDPDIFPDMTQLTAGQCKRLNEAIFKVFQTFKIELIDIPKDIPTEFLYEVLSTNLDHYVQYLPSSGFDLELCSGDPMTCPYGEFCDCGEEPDFSVDEPTDIDEDFDGEVPF